MSRTVEVERKQQLASAAVDVLQREGVDVSMAQLADALGIKRPTLLYHFPTKAHIVEVALVELLSEQATFVLERISAHTHPIDRLFAQLCAVHEFHRGREARVVFLSQAIAATSGERLTTVLEAATQVFEAHRQAAGALIRQGIADGLVAPCDPDALIATCRALTDGLMVQRVMGGTDLRPVHALIWERLLAPLKLNPTSSEVASTPSVSKQTTPRAKRPA